MPLARVCPFPFSRSLLPDCVPGFTFIFSFVPEGVCRMSSPPNMAVNTSISVSASRSALLLVLAE